MSFTQRFNQPTFGIMGEMESMLVDSCNEGIKMAIMKILKRCTKEI